MKKKCSIRIDFSDLFLFIDKKAKHYVFVKISLFIFVSLLRHFYLVLFQRKLMLFLKIIAKYFYDFYHVFAIGYLNRTTYFVFMISPFELY